jgi:hypothetical protein
MKILKETIEATARIRLARCAFIFPTFSFLPVWPLRIFDRLSRLQKILRTNPHNALSRSERESAA